jgi:hypothetical protein
MTAGALVGRVPLAGTDGSGTPTRTSRATSATVRARTARRSAAARGRRNQQTARHQHPRGLLDHHAVLQGDLQLAGQATLAVGGHRVAEQVGHHPGAGLQGADLALIPGALASHVGVEGGESISWAPSRVTSRTGTGARCQNASMQGPCASSSWACSICSACWSEAAAQRSARTAHRAKVMGLIFSGSSLILLPARFAAAACRRRATRSMASPAAATAHALEAARPVQTAGFRLGPFSRVRPRP